MKKILFIAVLATVTLFSCTEKAELKNTWEMTEYLGRPIDNDIFKVHTPTFTLNPEDGSFGGNNGCNQVNGKLEVTDQNISLEVQMGTRMFCEGVPEQEIEANIADVNNYSIKGDQLFLMKDNTTLFAFKVVNIE